MTVLSALTLAGLILAGAAAARIALRFALVLGLAIGALAAPDRLPVA